MQPLCLERALLRLRQSRLAGVQPQAERDMPENLPQSHQAAQKRPLVATSGKRLRDVQDFCRPRKDFDENSRQTQKS